MLRKDVQVRIGIRKETKGVVIVTSGTAGGHADPSAVTAELGLKQRPWGGGRALAASAKALGPGLIVEEGGPGKGKRERRLSTLLCARLHSKHCIDE